MALFGQTKMRRRMLGLGEAQIGVSCSVGFTKLLKQDYARGGAKAAS